MLTITASHIPMLQRSRDDASVRIIVHFLLDGNMTLTALLLILMQTAVPLFCFDTDYHHCSSSRGGSSTCSAGATASNYFTHGNGNDEPYIKTSQCLPPTQTTLASC